MADINNEEKNPTPLRIVDEGVPAAETTAAQQEKEQEQNGSEEEEEAGQNSGQEEKSGESLEEEKEAAEEEVAKEEAATEEKIFQSVNYREYRLEVVSDTGVVRPFLIATWGEAQQHYVTSFRALEDQRDEGIDRLTRDLQRVTHVRAVAGPLLENVVDAEEDEGAIDGREEEGREEEVRMPQQTDKQLEAELEALSVLFPRLLRESGTFEHLGDEALTGKWLLKRVLVPTNESRERRRWRHKNRGKNRQTVLKTRSQVIIQARRRIPATIQARRSLLRIQAMRRRPTRTSRPPKKGDSSSLSQLLGLKRKGLFQIFQALEDASDEGIDRLSGPRRVTM
ncbi:uncharacterized protein LOC116111728 [Pistacia vera]|uniref:uncharacterized protein LOC116111728 n=1 Tax=Pistacia vera TaxID=55513 RepID=UPI001263DBD3|nr:uncharacterized protein LOC116111728 [Pistacia vera]